MQRVQPLSQWLVEFVDRDDVLLRILQWFAVYKKRKSANISAPHSYNVFLYYYYKRKDKVVTVESSSFLISTRYNVSFYGVPLNQIKTTLFCSLFSSCDVGILGCCASFHEWKYFFCGPEFSSQTDILERARDREEKNIWWSWEKSSVAFFITYIPRGGARLQNAHSFWSIQTAGPQV